MLLYRYSIHTQNIARLHVYNHVLTFAKLATYSALVVKCNFGGINPLTLPSVRPCTVNPTRAQHLLRWATVPEQSGPKSGGVGCCALFGHGRQLGLHLTQCALGRDLPSSSSNKGAKSVIEQYRTTSNTSIPSGILIHPTVRTQYTNVTGRQTDRQRSDSIGWTYTKDLSVARQRISFYRTHSTSSNT